MLDKFFEALHIFIIFCLIMDNCLMREKLKSHFRMIEEAYDHIILIKNHLGLPLFLEKGDEKDAQ